MIQENEVAFLKTTGEAVFVLGFFPEEGTADVRRPIIGQDGIQHVISTFRVQELESLDDQQRRFVAERKAVMDKYGPKTPNEQLTFKDLGIDIN